jgi:hypothetical protein
MGGGAVDHMVSGPVPYLGGQQQQLTNIENSDDLNARQDRGITAVPQPGSFAAQQQQAEASRQASNQFTSQMQGQPMARQVQPMRQQFQFPRSRGR